MYPGLAPIVIPEFGPDIILAAGGGMLGHPHGYRAGAEAWRQSIDAVMNGERWVELQPAASSIRRLQHQMAREAHLVSHSYGKEPNRRVRIFRDT